MDLLKKSGSFDTDFLKIAFGGCVHGITLRKRVQKTPTSYLITTR